MWWPALVGICVCISEGLGGPPSEYPFNTTPDNCDLGRTFVLTVARIGGTGAGWRIVKRFDTILRTVGGQPGLRSASLSHRQTAKQRCAHVIDEYFTTFLPDLGRWRLLGHEISAPPAVFDLVWRDPRSGKIMADEIKSGSVVTIIERGMAEEQLARELLGGVQMWGDRFLGVRHIRLGDPAGSFLARPGEEREFPWRAGVSR